VSSKILAALFLVGGTTALFGGPVYSCGGGAACDGNLYAIWVVNQTATSYVLNVGIQVTSGYTGSVVNSINGLAIIPDNQGSFTAASLVSNPLGTWTLQNGGLSATGCDGTGTGYTCAGAIGTGAHLFSFSGGAASPNTLIWQFLITGTPPSLGNMAHIKYNYVDLGGNKVGDLGSFDIAIQCIGGSGCAGSTVPEPVTSALIGSGLIGLYFLRRGFPGSR
jgi:hypothetical protein